METMLVSRIAKVWHPLRDDVWSVGTDEDDDKTVLELVSAERWKAKPMYINGFHKESKTRYADNKQNHLMRIAYFCRFGFNDPISIDVGCPVLGYNKTYLDDGNHRLAAAIIMKKRRIPVTYSGEVEYAIKAFGLKFAVRYRPVMQR